MQQVHNINEDYEHYTYRKRNVNSNALIGGGIVALLFGYMSLEASLIGTSIPIFVGGAVLILIGFKIRR